MFGCVGEIPIQYTMHAACISCGPSNKIVNVSKSPSFQISIYHIIKRKKWMNRLRKKNYEQSRQRYSNVSSNLFLKKSFKETISIEWISSFVAKTTLACNRAKLYKVTRAGTITQIVYFRYIYNIYIGTGCTYSHQALWRQSGKNVTAVLVLQYLLQRFITRAYVLMWTIVATLKEYRCWLHLLLLLLLTLDTVCGTTPFLKHIYGFVSIFWTHRISHFFLLDWANLSKNHSRSILTRSLRRFLYTNWIVTYTNYIVCAQ